MKSKLCLLALLLAPWAAWCGNLPAPSIPASVGVAMHLYNIGGAQDYAMMAAAGIKIVRTDLTWVTTEQCAYPCKLSNTPSYNWSAYDALVSNLTQNGIRPYFILDYSNGYESLVPNTDSYTYYSPQHTDSIAAYARWAAAAAQHFSASNVIWEIWNEPNLLNTFWYVDPNLVDPPTPVNQYIALAQAACSAIRAADPNATVIGPAASTIDQAYLTPLLNSGILSCFNGVSVHPYRKDIPESVAADYQWLRAQINAAPYGGSSIPIISGEWGYSSSLGLVTQQTQADYLVRTQLFNLYSGIPVSIWYDWKDDGSNLADNNENYGLVAYQSSSTVKPSYTALQTLTTELSGYIFQYRIPLGSDYDYALLFKNAAGQYRIAAWTTRNLAIWVGVVYPVSLTPPAGFSSSPTTVSGSGTHTPVLMLSGAMQLLLSSSPQYIE